MLRENNFNIDTALNGNSTNTFKTEYGMCINNSMTICTHVTIFFNQYLTMANYYF